MWVWTNWPNWVKTLISLPLVIVLIAMFSSIGLFARKQMQTRTKESNVTQQAPSTSFSSDNIDEILQDINDTRASNNLGKLLKDERLCAYATKRALEYKQKGQASLLTDFKMEAEDPANKQAYFSNYSYVLSKAIGTAEDDLQKVADKYTAVAGQAAMSPKLTHACLAGLESDNEKMWLTVFVGGTKK